MTIGQEDRKELWRLDLLFETVDIDIVVCAAVHLGEPDFLFLGFKVVDINQFNIFHCVPAHQAVCQRVCRID